MPENELPLERQLQTAVRSGDLKEVRRLCEQGVDEDKSQNWGHDFRSSLLFSAIETYPDYSGGTPKARATGHTEIVDYLLTRGANPNIVSDSFVDDPNHQDNQTPLHWAARYGYKDIAALLIQRGADVNAKWASLGYTPLAQAVSSYTNDEPEPDEATKARIFDTIRLLVDKGADVNTKNDTQADPDNGNTILHRIVGSPELIKYLVEKGADVNARADGNGWTPLHQKAIFSSGTTTAQALIACGADVNAKDNGGRTPLDMARTDQMKALLQNSMARANPPPQAYTSNPSQAVSGTQMTGSNNGIIVLVLGIVSLVTCGFGILAAVPAWIMGAGTLKAINEGRSPASGKTMAQIGMILGIIGTVLSSISIITFLYQITRLSGHHP